jgi:hypothetical protein
VRAACRDRVAHGMNGQQAGSSAQIERNPR